jgi:hypothetical protein
MFEDCPSTPARSFAGQLEFVIAYQTVRLRLRMEEQSAQEHWQQLHRGNE